MKSPAFFRILLTVFALFNSASADEGTRITVVTHTGEKVEGTLRGIAGNELLLDVAGQSFKLPVETLKYISFVGEMENVSSQMKSATKKQPLDDALDAFKELRAATEVGILREQYSQKLLDTLPRVNAFVNGEKVDWADVRIAMIFATRLYQDALNRWGEKDSILSTVPQDDWSSARAFVDYAALLASYPGEKTHREKPSETSIMVGASADGRLGVGDSIMSKELDRSSAGGFNDVFKVMLASQTNLDINLRTKGGCPPHLTLVDALGKKLDGSSGNIRRNLNPGTYTIWAGTHPGYACLFTLTVTAKR